MDTTLSSPIGQLLDGRYLVESQLARGGMATVYLARDVRLDRTVALKIAHPELAREPEFAARFIGEARAVARLSSPHVVGIFDQGTTGDINYIAMEYVPGPTLRELLNARGRLGPREALDIIEGVLTGLAAAHEAGIVHRDVKPENVLLGSGNLVKVADFGLARAAAGTRHTKTGLLIGTAAYLAPEQVATGASDQRTDVYAAGIMLFEMLTGSQPHTGDTPLAVAYQHVNAVVPAPSTLVPGLPSALDTLVALATSRDPELRPPDAGHYLQAIAQVRQGMPVPGLRRAAHAAPGTAAESDGLQDRNGLAFPASATARLGVHGNHQAVSGVLPTASGLAGPAEVHRTMIVPAGLDADYPAASGNDGTGARWSRRGYGGYREPFLQRWLFSRRILFVLGVIVLGVVVWWLVSGQYFSMPSAVRMPVRNARTELSNAGLIVTVGKARFSDTVPKGDVIRTSPASGAQVKHGDRVTIIPSLGPQLVSMPQVTGQPLTAAEQAVRSAGLTYKAVPQPSSIQSGVVFSTSPVAYQLWPKDKPVQLFVSDGPPLPDFVGQQLQAAQGEAQQGGYQIAAQAEPKSNQPANTIVRQEPAAGSPVVAGEVVTVWVSQGPPQVTVPDVTGMSEHDAIKALHAAGFQVQVQGGALSKRVTAYYPTGPQPQGTTITLIVGFGL
jgi:eukaryotic-like serine/threonine-protein kinase